MLQFIHISRNKRQITLNFSDEQLIKEIQHS